MSRYSKISANETSKYVAGENRKCYIRACLHALVYAFKIFLDLKVFVIRLSTAIIRSSIDADQYPGD
jgi:hypothetical protein